MTNGTNWKENSLLSRWSKRILDWANPSRSGVSINATFAGQLGDISFLQRPVFLFADHPGDGSSLQKLLVWVFPWQLYNKHSLSLWGLCLPTRMMVSFCELARELCFCFSLANLSICVYLIFISQCAVSIGRKRRCLTSVFHNLIISLERKRL